MLTVFPWDANCVKRIVMTILKYIHENINVRFIANRLYGSFIMGQNHSQIGNFKNINK